MAPAREMRVQCLEPFAYQPIGNFTQNKEGVFVPRNPELPHTIIITMDRDVDISLRKSRPWTLRGLMAPPLCPSWSPTRLGTWSVGRSEMRVEDEELLADRDRE